MELRGDGARVAWVKEGLERELMGWEVDPKRTVQVPPDLIFEICGGTGTLYALATPAPDPQNNKTFHLPDGREMRVEVVWPWCRDIFLKHGRKR